MSEWVVKVEHPNGRVVTPALLDNPQFLPNPNGKPELTIPISKDTAWLREEWDNAPVRAYNDGRRVPVERLVEQSLTNGHIELVAEGGVELDETVDVEIGEEFSHEAFGDIVTEHTPYSLDIDDPGEELSEDQLLALVETQQAFEDFLIDAIEDTEPFDLSDGELTTLGSATWDTDPSSGNSFTRSDGDGFLEDDAESETYQALLGSGQDVEFVSISPEHEIPEEHAVVAIRKGLENGAENNISGDPGDFFHTVELDGQEIASVNTPVLPEGDFEWQFYDANKTLDGNHTVEISLDQSFDDGSTSDPGLGVDVCVIYDDRFTSESDFDNSVSGSGNWLDSPGTHPTAADIELGDAVSFFSIVTAYANIAIDDTGNDQALAISGDSGATWHETANTDSAEHTFDEPVTSIRTRLTLSNHSPQGPRDQTPRLGYAGQTVSELEIRADVDESPLTVDYSNEDSVETIINDVAGQGFIWEFTYQNGEPTISLTQPGDRVAIGTPDIVDLSVTKDTHTYQKVSVRGANRSVRDEAFSASDTFENLNRANIIPGTETVRSDTGETFDRGEDYTMAWTDGQIRRLSDSDMTQGETYRIDYDFEVRGSFALDGVDEPKELVTDLPGVVAERSAELVAQQLVQIVSEPQWSGEATIPARESLFSGIEALNLAIKDADLPDSAMPLVPSDRVDVGPQGIVYTLGSGPDIAEVISDVRSRTASISKRV